MPARSGAPQPTALQSPEGGASAREPLLTESTLDPNTPWYSRRGEGLATLAGFLEVAGVQAAASCAQIERSGWRCEKQQAQTWDLVLDFDRPALLSLVTEGRFAAYAVLVGASTEQAYLLYQGHEIVKPLAELGRLWQGEFVFLWQPPPDYSGPVSQGDSGPVVAWLAQEFAHLDGQPRPLTTEAFNVELDSRVRLFQRQFNLLDDGVVGMKTLLKLGEVRGTARPLARPTQSLANAGVQ